MSSLILKDKLFEEVLIKPAKDFDTLCVVSGFATPAMVAHHLEAVKITHNIDNLKIKLIIGMTPLLGISNPHHKNFIKLTDDRNELFECSYINSASFPIHTKLYTWLKDDKPQRSFLSSANYTLTAFKRTQEEIACVCNPAEAFEYYNSKISHSLYCTCDEASELVMDKVFIPRLQSSIQVQETPAQGETVRLPLFSERDNNIHSTAGLNWGQREGREPNQAYIPVPSDIAKSGFFPPRGEQFSVLTDDGFPFVCVIAQPKIKGGDIGFAIHTTNNNSEFGEYFRRKLGVALGQFVTLDDLDRYGNRYVTFNKIDEEEYYMEFTPDQNK